MESESSSLHEPKKNQEQSVSKPFFSKQLNSMSYSLQWSDVTKTLRPQPLIKPHSFEDI